MARQCRGDARCGSHRGHRRSRPDDEQTRCPTARARPRRVAATPATSRRPKSGSCVDRRFTCRYAPCNAAPRSLKCVDGTGKPGPLRVQWTDSRGEEETMGTQPNDRPEERVDLWPVPELALAPKPAQAVADEDTPLNRLLRVFESHTAAETDTVIEYRRLAETSADPTVALLMQLVPESEERHHGLLARLSSRLHDAPACRPSADA